MTNLIFSVCDGHIELMFPIGPKGHLGPPEVKISNHCKHYISRSVTVRDPILSMLIAYIKYMITIAFGEGQRSVWVTTG